MPSQLQEIVDAIRRRPFVEPLIELERFAKDETLHGQGGQERRRFRRYSLITNVVVLPLTISCVPSVNRSWHFRAACRSTECG